MATIELTIRDRSGNEVERVAFDPALLGGDVNRALLRDVVVMYEANLRQGNAATKERRYIAGSTRKPWRQKGTGRARSGSRKSPLWRGGGTIFGPQPRDYSYQMPKHQRRRATQSALLSKFLDGEVVIVTDLSLEQPKTREVAKVLKTLGIAESCLIGVPERDEALSRSARNIPNVGVPTVGGFNAYELLRRKRLLLTKSALTTIMTTPSCAGCQKE